MRGASDTPSPSRTTTVWQLLGLPAGAPKERIRKEYKKFVLREHPDMGGGNGPEQVERFARITEAYRDIMRADDDKFWLEAFDARVSAIVLKREKRWAETRWLLREAQRYRQSRRAPAPGPAPGPAEVAGGTGVRGGGWGADQLLLGALLALAGLVLASFLLLLASGSRA